MPLSTSEAPAQTTPPSGERQSDLSGDDSVGSEEGNRDANASDEELLIDSGDEQGESGDSDGVCRGCFSRLHIY